MDISSSRWAIFFQIFKRPVQNNFRFLLCLSVCSLSHFLTEIRLSLDISSSRWAIFFKFSGDISGMFLHLFKILSDFLYACQSVHCPTSLLKLGYIWISVVLDDLSFSNFWETFPGCFCTSMKQFLNSCMSVSLSIASLPYWYHVNSEYLLLWMN